MIRKKKLCQRLFAFLSVIVIIAMLMTSFTTSFAAEENQQPDNSGPAVEQPAGDQGGGDAADPENPSVDPENPSVDPDNPSVDPDNPSVDPENPEGGDKKDEDKKDEDGQDDGKKGGDRGDAKNGGESGDEEDTPVSHRWTKDTDAYSVVVTCDEFAGVPEGYELDVAEGDALSDEAALAIVGGDVLPLKNYLKFSIKKGDASFGQLKGDIRIEFTLKDVPDDDRGKVCAVNCSESTIEASSTDAIVRFDTRDLSPSFGFMFTATYRHHDFDYFMQNNENELAIRTLLTKKFKYDEDKDLAGSMNILAKEHIDGADDKLVSDTTEGNWKLTRTKDTSGEWEKPFGEALLKIRLANGYGEDKLGDDITINLYDNPEASGDANDSGKVQWARYLVNSKKDDGTTQKIQKLVFALVDKDATGEDASISNPLKQKDGLKAKIDNKEIYKQVQEVQIGEGITGIGWYYLGTNASDVKPPISTDPPFKVDEKEPGTAFFKHTDVFADFESLTTIKFDDPGKIEVIGWSSFRRCKALKEFDFSQLTGLKVILNQAFNPTSLETVDLSNSPSLQVISYLAFSANQGNEKSLKNVYLPDEGTVKIAQDAFYKNNNIQTLHLGNGTEFYDKVPNELLNASTVVVNGTNWPVILTKVNGQYTKRTNISFKDNSKIEELVISANFPIDPDDPDKPSLPANIFKNCSKLKKLTISGNNVNLPAGADNAFVNCTALTEIVVSGANDKIPANTFSGFENLTKLTISKEADGTIIEANAFKGSNIKTIEMRGSNTTIGANAFDNCDNLGRVLSIEGDHTTIDASAFANCDNLGSLFVLGNDVKIKDGAFKNTPLTSIFIGGNVTELGTGVFDGCSDLRAVTITGTLSNIPAQTFKNCKNLRTLNMSGTVNTIGSEAFYGCDSLETVTLSAGLTSLGESAFEKCTGLTRLTIQGELSITPGDPPQNAFGSKAFKDCTYLETVTINGIIDEIPADAFEGCTYLETLNVSADATVNKIADKAFANAAHLETLNLAGSVAAIGNNAFENCRALETVTLPASLTSLGNNAFDGCRGLTDLTINSNLPFTAGDPDQNAFGSEAFKDCANLETVTINGTIGKIPSDAFDGCRNLTTLTVAKDATVTKIDDHAFEGLTHLDTLNLNGSVVEIGESAFEGCRALTTVTLPASLTSVGESAFEGCAGMTSLTINSTNLSSLGDGSFGDCTNLQSITVNGKVSQISGEAFDGCRNLTTLTVNEGAEITKIDSNAFAGFSRLTTLDLSGTVGEIGESAFEGCRGLTTVTLPASLTSLGADAFKDCTRLADLTINSQLEDKTFPSGAFSGCKALANVTLTNSNITTIGDNAFDGCRALTTIAFPKDASNKDVLTTIGKEAFKDCTSLNISLPDSLKSIGNNAFENCRGLTTVALPTSLTSLGTEAFKDCTQLTTATIASSLADQTLPNSAFTGCSRLTSVDMTGSNITTIDQNAFYNCSKLAVVTFPKDADNQDIVTTIADNAFRNCSNLREAILPTSLTSLGASAYQDCVKLTTASIPENLKNIPDSAFEGCTKLATLKVANANALESIAEDAFNNTGLRRIYDDTQMKKVFTKAGAKSLFGDKITDNTFENTNLLKEAPEIVVTVKDVTVPYDGFEHEGSDKYDVSGLQSEDTLTPPDYTKPKGTEMGSYNGSFADVPASIKDKQDPRYDSYDNYKSVTLNAGKLTIAQSPKQINVYITGQKDSATYDGKSHTVTGYTVKADAPSFSEDDYIFTQPGSDRATRTDAGTTDMGLDGKFVANPQGHYPNAKFHVVDGSVTIDPANVHVSITGHKGTNVYDRRDHTTEGFEFSANNPLYKRSDFTYSGSVSATRRDVGTTYMELSPSQFRNTNKNFNATFSVNDGNQSIGKNTVHVTIIGHNAVSSYDGESHTVEGFEFSASNPLYTRADFAFSGVARATRDDVGTTNMGLSLGQFSNVNENFDVSFTIIDGYQTINLEAGRSASLFSANLANHVFPGGGLYIASNDHWGLLNLMFTVITILIALWAVLWRNFRESDTPLKFSLISEILSAIPAVAAIVFFFATENLTLPMKIIDQWSFVMAIFVLIEWAIVYSMKTHHEEKGITRVKI